jgi:hypothetical protein
VPQFNATDAIFFGFRVIKRDPLMMLALAALTAVVAVAGALLTWRESIALLTAAEELTPTGTEPMPPEDMAKLSAAYAAYFGSPKIVLFLLASAVVWLVTKGAILRALVRDTREGWIMGMQLGGDELRILVVSLIVNILVFLLLFGGFFVVALVASVLVLMSPALAGVLVLLACAAGALGLALVGVRLSAATAATVGEKKLILFGSWRLTEGHMWGMLGAYVVLAFIGLAASFFVVIPAVLLSLPATTLQLGMTAPDALDDPGAFYGSPGYVVVNILYAILSVVLTAAWSGVGAYAYRMLGGRVGYPNARPVEAPAAAWP